MRICVCRTAADTAGASGTEGERAAEKADTGGHGTASSEEWGAEGRNRFSGMGAGEGEEEAETPCSLPVPLTAFHGSNALNRKREMADLISVCWNSAAISLMPPCVSSTKGTK